VLRLPKGTSCMSAHNRLQSGSTCTTHAMHHCLCVTRPCSTSTNARQALQALVTPWRRAGAHCIHAMAVFCVESWSVHESSRCLGQLRCGFTTRRFILSVYHLRHSPAAN
jgi:hypothetical protein